MQRCKLSFRILLVVAFVLAVTDLVGLYATGAFN